MALVPLTKQTLAQYSGRFAKLAENSTRLWGTMTAVQMLNHVRLLLELPLGERTLKDISNWFTRTRLAHWLLIDVMPWPKGRLKPPMKLIDDNLGTFEEERSKLLEVMQRFADLVETDPQRIVRSPFLGPITLKFWSRLQGKHLDHHLRQFGA